MKFQFQIRQKCRSKWNDIGHTLELGPHCYNLAHILVKAMYE